ncbi:HAD-IIB family hydrolase [Leifsonia sp. YAF41]|uniref:HAD-IIB family hydrolase n=1 Tax=Leifsonia sp. YAF41 TaxID=3233086 RepID=UPI003F973955
MTETTLFLSDLDGTLLASNGTLSTLTRTTINRLIADDGLLFSYATARSFASASVVLAGLQVRMPVAVYGGALIVDGMTGAVLTRYGLDSAVVSLVLAECRARDLPPIVYEFRDGRDWVSWNQADESPGTRNYTATRRGDRRMRPVDSWEGLPHDGVFYLTIIGGREAITGAADVLAAQLAGLANLVVQRDNYYPDEYWLEISAAEANKAVAAVALQRYAGAERLVCFGDNNNDLPMFAVADASYATALANETVRAAASAVIGASDDDAVAHHLVALHPASRRVARP